MNSARPDGRKQAGVYAHLGRERFAPRGEAAGGGVGAEVAELGVHRRHPSEEILLLVAGRGNKFGLKEV
ncbi:MAG: hypothetical protein EAZ36_07770, partial [Verrucomicrobia bacterium]